MSLKFKYILTEDAFPSSEGDKLKPKEEKLLKNIHDYILVRYYSENYPHIDDKQLPTELVDLEEFSDLYAEIWDFLTLTMLFDKNTATHLFYLFVLNYNRDGIYTNIENVRTLNYDDQKEIFDVNTMVLSDHFNTLPFLIERLSYDEYDIPSYNVKTENKYYACGDEEAIERGKKDYVESYWSDGDEVYHSFGAEHYITYCFVGDTDKRMISSEEASHYESDMDEEEVIDYLRDNMREYEKAKSIVKAYDEVAEAWGELPASAAGAPYQMKMTDIADDGRETVREIIYDYTYERLEDDLVDYLFEWGYISKEQGGYVTMNKKQWENLPSWVDFDWEDFEEDQVQNMEIEQLSPYEDVDRVYLDNGDIYYIIQIEQY